MGRVGVQLLFLLSSWLWKMDLGLMRASGLWYLAVMGNPMYIIRKEKSLKFSAWKDIGLLLWMCFIGVLRFLILWSKFIVWWWLLLLLMIFIYFNLLFLLSFSLEIFPLDWKFLERRVWDSFAALVCTSIWFSFMWVYWNPIIIFHTYFLMP